MMSLYRHKDGGLDGVRCGFYVPGTINRVTLTWDSVDCPDCLAVKKDWEPMSVTIDTRGD